ncbi:2-hydroxyacid dehydrogenase [Ignicoccus islandicus DSM 13165]|uniref:2-hydroxyacid dehydrogenase n=1 Tax=Ignicoccus islandicus DSM 13165 TaxID=940295 RepID=A0A0U2WL49_9CREN|nr:2-hydroxyacid dehydrogenase [Ignicoccus islandicus DSM 13165]
MKRLKDTFKELPENEFIAFYVWKRTKSPLATLIATIISQNTTEKASFKAWNNLMSLTHGDWKRICDLDINELMSALRVTGLYKQKAETIKSVCEKSEELEKAILKGDRNKLLEISGIGPKTADVVLALFNHKRFPVDTHVFRVSKRLGLAKGSYEAVSSELLKLFPENPLQAHMYLILLGRKFCKKQRPLCEKCPLRDLCPSARIENNSG